MSSTNEKKALRAGLWYTVTNYFVKGAVYLTIPIFSAILTKAEIGKYMNITNWLQVLLPLMTFEYSASLTLARFEFKDEFDRYISSSLLYGTIVAALVGAVFLIFHNFFEQLFNMERYVLWIIVPYIMFFPALQFYQSLSMIRYEHKKIVFITLANFLVPLALSLLFAFLWKDRLAGRIVGFYAPTVILCIILFTQFLKSNSSFTLKYLPYAFKISFPIIWHTLAIHLLALGDRIVITKTLGDEKNALYSIAYTVCGLVSILWSSMNSAWSPWCTEKMHQKDSAIVQKYSRPYLLVFSVIMIFVMLIAPEVLLVMGAGKGYYEARFVIPPILTGLVAQFVYSMYVNLEFYNKMQTRISIGTILAAAINIVLNIILVPKYGYTAAGYTTLIGYLCLLIYHYASARISKLGRWYNDKFNFATVLFFLLLLPLINYLYNAPLIRYIILLVYTVTLLAAIIINRKKLIIAWKSLRG